jgi:hypothetical protein
MDGCWVEVLGFLVSSSFLRKKRPETPYASTPFTQNGEKYVKAFLGFFANVQKPGCINLTTFLP